MIQNMIARVTNIIQTENKDAKKEEKKKKKESKKEKKKKDEQKHEECLEYNQ